MGNSYCDYRGNTVLVNDSAILNIIKLLQFESRSMFSGGEYPQDLNQQFAFWYDACEKCGVGCIDLELDDTIKTHDQQILFLLLLDLVQEAAEAQGVHLSKDFLEARIGLDFRDGIQTDVLLRDLRKFRSLLKGELENGVAIISE